MTRDNKKRIEVIWKPHKGPQHAFITAKEDEVLYGGGKGSGKTDVLIMYPLTAPYIHHPKFRALIVRKTYKRLLELKDRCDFYYKKIDPGCRYNSDEHRYYMSSGAIIRLGHCEKPGDEYNYWGHEFHQVLIDQVEEIAENQYEIIRLSARTSVPELRPIIRCTANPGASWVKERWIDVVPWGSVYEHEMKTPSGNVSKITRRYIHGTIYDNPTLIENNKEYLASLESIANDTLRRQMLFGDWEVAQGAAFEEFDRRKHVKRLYDALPDGGRPPEGWPVFCTMDWGYSTPFAIYWHTITPYDKIITFREYYGIAYDPIKKKPVPNSGLKMIATDVAKVFLQKSADLKIDFIIADKSMWNKMGQSSGSIGQEFELVLAEKNIPMIPSDNSAGTRASRKMQTHARFSNAPDGSPWWIITEECVHLIRTLPLLRVEEHNPELVDTTGEDHAYDSVSIGFLHFPIQQTILVRQSNNTLNHMDEYRRNIEGKRIQSLGLPVAYSYH